MIIEFQDPNIDRDLESRLRDAVEDAERVSQLQGVNTDDFHVEIRLYDDVFNNKPQPDKILGAGIVDDNKFVLVIDPDNAKDPKVIDQFTSLAVHEMNHLERMSLLGGDPQTLSEVLVSEGLAQVAEIEAGYEPISLEASDGFDAITFSKKVEAYLDVDLFTPVRPTKDFDYWFAPDSEEHGIAYAGYQLGFNIVSGYMKDQGVSLNEVMERPAQEIIEHWRNKREALSL